jgi:steroid delta-isomerase
MSTAPDLVARYYELVDQRMFEDLSELYALDCRYRRPGFDEITGRGNLLRFYRELRQISDGQHSLDTVLLDGQYVVVLGRFSGTLYDGSAVAAEFCDVFELAPSQRPQIRSRSTYFFTPSV